LTNGDKVHYPSCMMHDAGLTGFGIQDARCKMHDSKCGSQNSGIRIQNNLIRPFDSSIVRKAHYKGERLGYCKTLNKIHMNNGMWIPDNCIPG
jgi:hypothetical protein